MDDDDWQEMPVVRETAAASSSSSDEGGPRYSTRKTKAANNAYSARHAFKHGRTNSSGYGTLGSGGDVGQLSGATNATGRHLDIDDARGYSWRAKPEGLGDAGGMGAAKKETKAERKARLAKLKKRKAAKKGHEDSASSVSSSDSEGDESEDGARGYTQLRLDDDVEAEQINAATDYLFTGGTGTRDGAGRGGLDELDDVGATPHSQLNTTKNLLSEGQKIAYVGLVSLAAKTLVRQLERVPGKDLKAAIGSADEWRLRVMARLFQHMDIESGEQRMIESLAEHGVLIGDLAPSLITTQTVDNPDFDPQALLEREEEEERQKQEEDEKVRQEALTKYGDEHQSDNHAHSSEKSSDSGLDTRARAEIKNELDRSDADEQERRGGRASSSHSSDFDSGDLGESHRPQSCMEKPSDIQTSLRQANLDADDGGDITSQNGEPGAKVVAAAGTAAAADESTTVVDPNTAARVDAIGETLDDGTTKVTPMGLTSQPQTIDTLPSALEGVTTELSSADKTITLDLRWTVLCDLFLVLTADSVYDARSRVLLEQVAEELGLTWMDVTKFEKRVTDALEIEEGVAGSLKGKKAVRKRADLARRRRMVMMGLATVGGGLVIGLSAGLMAPLIGVGLGAALGTMGIGGTSAFLGGVGGAAIITSTGTVAGAALGGTGMSRRTKSVSTFEFKPIHNNKRVNCIIAVPGFMNGPQDDPRLPFSVVDSIMGDIFSLLWEPDMMQEMGNAIYLLWSEALVQGVQQVLAATIAGGLVGALALPLWLTKLGYFIDNPWSNALDRAHACGLILADVLSKRKMGVRPITLVGFSLGARVIFYALVELARTKKYGIVQNVYLIGAPITANDKTWKEARSVVAGRFVNAYSRTDWILGWLFRATTGGLRSIAGLRPVERVPEVENVDVTQTVPGHLQYRAFMPLVLDQLGFRTTAEYFDEPEDLDKIPERELVYDQPPEDERKLKTVKTATGGFGRIFRRKAGGPASESGSDVTPGSGHPSRRPSVYEEDDDLPPREDSSPPRTSTDVGESPSRSSFAIDETERALAELRESGIVVRELQSSLPTLAVRTGPVPPPRRGSKLKDSIKIEPSHSDDDDDEDDDKEQEGSYGDNPTQSKDSTFTAVGVAPKLTVSDADAQIKSSAPISVTDDVAAPVVERSSSSSSVSRGRVTPTRSYARPFGSTTFDADGLPPSAPSISSSGDVSLSFGESYEADEPPSQNAAEQAQDEQHRNDGDTARRQYGLSADAARELAMQFQSAGMSDAGALAAARMAQNFEAMDDGVRRPSLPMSAYDASSGGGDADPWGSGPAQATEASSGSNVNAPHSTTLLRGRAVSDAESASILAVPPTTHAWNSDNPWG